MATSPVPSQFQIARLKREEEGKNLELLHNEITFAVRPCMINPKSWASHPIVREGCTVFNIHNKRLVKGMLKRIFRVDGILYFGVLFEMDVYAQELPHSCVCNHAENGCERKVAIDLSRITKEIWELEFKLMMVNSTDKLSFDELKTIPPPVPKRKRPSSRQNPGKSLNDNEGRAKIEHTSVIPVQTEKYDGVATTVKSANATDKSQDSNNVKEGRSCECIMEGIRRLTFCRKRNRKSWKMINVEASESKFVSSGTKTHQSPQINENETTTTSSWIKPSSNSTNKSTFTKNASPLPEIKPAKFVQRTQSTKRRAPNPPPQLTSTTTTTNDHQVVSHLVDPGIITLPHSSSPPSYPPPPPPAKQFSSTEDNSNLLLEQIRSGIKLKHVDTDDRSSFSASVSRSQSLRNASSGDGNLASILMARRSVMMGNSSSDEDETDTESNQIYEDDDDAWN